MHLVLCAALLASTAELDAPLHAVRFVDRNEGWAAGADGVVWHTIDGGVSWERQPVATRGTIHSVQFITPYIGFMAGREEVQATGSSAGVLLATRDGGLTWSRLARGMLPGLHSVHFFDDRQGLTVGAGNDRFPSGIHQTSDGGATWQAVPGPAGQWRAAAFTGPGAATLVGENSRVMTLRGQVLAPAEVDLPRGRVVHGVAQAGNTVVAVGQAGLVLVSDDGGRKYSYAALPLPPELASVCDFHGVAIHGDQICVVGNPGSFALVSEDAGKTWAARATGQPTPLHAVTLLDKATGWAVGELGTILGTKDGGQSWSALRGNCRPAILCISARGRNVPLDLIARLGGADDYRIASLVVAAPGDTDAKLSAAVRKAGGAASATFANFDAPAHLDAGERDDLVKYWNIAHSGKSLEELTRRLTVALRVWQPDVVVVDFAGSPAESILVELIEAAVRDAADAEQLLPARLDAAKVKKVYCLWDGPGAAHVIVPTSDVAQGQSETPRELAHRLMGLLGDGPALPKQRGLRLLQSNLSAGQGLGGVMDGIPHTPGSTARRSVDLSRADRKPDREMQTLNALAHSQHPIVGDPGTVLPRIQAALNKMPEEQGANAMTALAMQYARSGQWDLARETYQIAAERYAKEPAGLEALRWLVRYQSSSEARRRFELKQTIGLQRIEFSTITGEKEVYNNNSGVKPLAEGNSTRSTAVISDPVAARKWYQSAIALEPKIRAQGTLAAEDPALMLPLLAAKRQLGDADSGKGWIRRFIADQAGQVGDDAWRTCARQELWIAERNGPTPRFAAQCRKTSSRPMLDGKLDDKCWQDVVPVTLKPTGDEYATRVRYAYDDEYLYIGIEASHPEAGYRPAVERRTRDMDVDKFDRVEILLDLDRDYATYYRFRIDQRGAAADDCWGDSTWNPKWYIASVSEKTGYTIEAAIKLADLTGDPIPPGKAWAMNAVRIIPGKGIRSAGVPADVIPRPEGCGAMVFTDPGR